MYAIQWTLEPGGRLPPGKRRVGEGSPEEKGTKVGPAGREKIRLGWRRRKVMSAKGNKQAFHKCPRATLGSRKEISPLINEKGRK